MMNVVSKLPEGIELSHHLLSRVARRKLGKRKYAFFQIELYGRTFYVPITNEVWEVFALKDSDFLERRDGVECTRPGLEVLFRELIDSTALQVRDSILSDVQQEVMSEVMDRIQGVLSVPIRSIIEQSADEHLKKELPDEFQSPLDALLL